MTLHRLTLCRCMFSPCMSLPAAGVVLSHEGCIRPSQWQLAAFLEHGMLLHPRDRLNRVGVSRVFTFAVISED